MIACRMRTAELEACWRARGMSDTGIRRAFGRPVPALAEVSILAIAAAAKKASAEKRDCVRRIVLKGYNAKDPQTAWSVILKEVAVGAGVSPEEILGRVQDAPSARARALAVWLIARLAPGDNIKQQLKFFHRTENTFMRLRSRALWQMQEDPTLRAWRDLVVARLGLGLVLGAGK